jgi:hypothetical protein
MNCCFQAMNKDKLKDKEMPSSKSTTDSEEANNKNNNKQGESTQEDGSAAAVLSFRKCLTDLIVAELRGSLKEASSRILSNDNQVEELEENIRNYEDQIRCLEQLVGELQQMLRVILEKEESPPSTKKVDQNYINNINNSSSSNTSTATMTNATNGLVEVPLNDFQEKEKLRERAETLRSKSDSLMKRFLSNKTNSQTTKQSPTQQSPTQQLLQSQPAAANGSLDDFH